VFLFFAGIILVSGAITCDCLCGRSWKHYCAVGSISTIVVFGGAWYLDKWAVRTKAEQDRIAKIPSPTLPTKITNVPPPTFAFKKTPPNTPRTASTNTVTGNQNAVGNTVTQGAGGISQIGNGNTVIVPQAKIVEDAAPSSPVAVYIAPGARLNATCSVIAGPNGKGIENHGEVNLDHSSVNAAQLCSPSQIKASYIDGLISETAAPSFRENSWTRFCVDVLGGEFGAQVAKDFAAQSNLEKRIEFLKKLKASLQP
jgi:hypothetical protein